jgi:hypothetical protein
MPYLGRKLKHYKGRLSDMNVEQWVGLSVGIATLIGAAAMGVRHLVKYYLAELKPNSGSSMRDEQTRQGESIKRLENRVDEIYRLLLNRA